MFKVYVIVNSNGYVYIGQTSDLNKRIFQHQNNLSKSTKNKGPFKLLYTEGYNSRAEAMRREKFLKSGQGRGWLEQKIKDGAWCNG